MNFFRIPSSADFIIQSIQLTPEEEKNYKQRNSNALILSSPPPEKYKKLKSRFPILFTWTIYHQVVEEKTESPLNLDQRLKTASQEWRQILAKRDLMFFMFFKEWLMHIKNITKGTPFDWTSLPAYVIFTNAFLYEIDQSNNFNKAVMDASSALLSTNLSLINIFIRTRMSRTPVYQIPQVLGKHSIF